MARQVAYAEATVTDADGQLVSRSTGTFLLHRPDDGRRPRLTRPGRRRPARGRGRCRGSTPAGGRPTEESPCPRPVRPQSTPLPTVAPSPVPGAAAGRAPCAGGRSTGPGRSASAAGTVAAQLGLPLVPTGGPVPSTGSGTGLHRRLRGYKDARRRPRPGRPSRRSWWTDLVRGRRGRRGPTAWLGSAWAVVTTGAVDRAGPGRPRSRTWSTRCPAWPPGTCRCWSGGRVPVGHLRAGRDGFALATAWTAPGWTGWAVLVFDDSIDHRGAGPERGGRPAPGRGARVVGPSVARRAGAGPGAGPGPSMRPDILACCKHLDGGEPVPPTVR